LIYDPCPVELLTAEGNKLLTLRVKVRYLVAPFSMLENLCVFPS